jgi:hypothetical protein
VNFNIDVGINQKIGRVYQMKTGKRNENMTPVDVSKILALVTKLTQSTVNWENALALLLVSGCRPIELVFKNKFELVKGKPGSIKVSNIAKKKTLPGENIEDTKKKFAIRPIIQLGGKTFITMANAFRKSISHLKLTTKRNQLSGHVADHIRQTTYKYLPEFKGLYQKQGQSDLTRAIYSSIAYELYADKTKINRNYWTKGVLAHESVSTSFAYSNFYAVLPPNLETEKIRTLQLKVEDLSKKVDSKMMPFDELAKVTRNAAQRKFDDIMDLLQRIYDEHNSDITNLRMRKLARYKQVRSSRAMLSIFAHLALSS